MRLRDGEVFAGYRVLRQLGRGGMAYVYLAEEAGIARQVALKLLPEDVADDAEAVARFEHEAQTVATLEHPHIVPLYRYGIERGAPWMALRLVRGGDLAERLQRPLAVAEGVQIFRQIAKALDFAHAHQDRVIHRDLKPQNVLLSRDEGGEVHAYLADFGIAKVLAGSARVRTRSGGILGTPQYMAPESARGEALGPAADIYALGVMAFQWQTGSLPFDADTPPVDVARVLRKALDKDARARPATAVALVEQLALALGGAAASSAPTPPPTARVEPAARFPGPPAAPRPLPTARAEPAEARDPISDATPPPATSTPAAPVARSTGWLWAAGLGFTGIVGLALWSGRQPVSVPIGEVRPAPPVSTSPASPAPSPSSAVPQTSDGLVLVPVGGALPEVGVPFRHALKRGGEGPVMVGLQGGSFLMGSNKGDPGHESDEGPEQRRVTIRPYAGGKYELTRGEFAVFVAANPGFRTDAEKDGGCYGLKDGNWALDASFNWRGAGFAPYDDGHPVICVSWNDAQAYVRWLAAETGASYRLPSEAEQEYAIRAGRETAYAWGPDENAGCGAANAGDASLKAARPDWPWSVSSCSDGHAYTAPVGSLAENDFGLHDVVGNVWEWGQDCYVASYAAAPVDGRAVEPKGQKDCTARVLRGASWGGTPAWLRSASRNVYAPSFRFFNTGFRVALDR
ncbi:MAG: SUMF1/EgtB/PvdO family nonheme iron enzyme [Xanthomonadales bacterium]|nr:SUMF1/EgtB/PvdO family nonheme iron enzyme [Xanthomonadales bacterium]